MIQNYKCNEIKIKCSEFSHTIDATFLKIHWALSHAFIAKWFRCEISRHANLRDKKSGRPTGSIGVRGDAPVGAQGAKPPEAPGFMRILK